MRIKRRQLAEEQAHKAPIKMLIPMAIFIFPALCIVLMAPAILILIESGVGPLGG
jgi:tight adherence protein C